MFIQVIFTALVQIVLGLALCFAGYRVFVLALPVFGFFGGFIVTAGAIQELFGGGFLATASGWVFGFVVGICCALLAYFFYTAAIIILAAVFGFEVGIGIVAGLGGNPGFLMFIVGLVLAAAFAAVVIFLEIPRMFIVALTALVGSTMILTGILLAVGRIPLASMQWGVVGAFIRDSWFWSFAYLVIAAAGMVAQLIVLDRLLLDRLLQESGGPERMAQSAANAPFSARMGSGAGV